ncbi:Uncharacterised protein [Chlamydia trachomatis]|nr:Uncharacterised protein [Chlamydia trachomatis]
MEYAILLESPITKFSKVYALSIPVCSLGTGVGAESYDEVLTVLISLSIERIWLVCIVSFFSGETVCTVDVLSVNCEPAGFFVSPCSPDVLQTSVISCVPVTSCGYTPKLSLRTVVLVATF